jgi:hypothetical protein
MVFSFSCYAKQGLGASVDFSARESIWNVSMASPPPFILKINHHLSTAASIWFPVMAKAVCASVWQNRTSSRCRTLALEDYLGCSDYKSA